MQVPVELTERNVNLDEAAKQRIIDKAYGLDNYFDRITACRVVAEVPHQHQNKGVEYRIQIEVDVPGKLLVVKRKPNVDLNAAIRDAFDAARRQLEDYARELRGDVKLHTPQPVGRILRVFRDDGYGFIESPEGDEIYFHENSLLKGHFEKLKVGDKVRYEEEMGDKGPQASTVRAV